jgi:SNF2 family DNA or RNA helicase
MGLGKTLQTISFIQFIKEKYKGQTTLVICPVSLIFNWQKELEKFAPTIKYKIHYGLERSLTKEDFARYDIVLTSYSLVRNDAAEFSKYFWQYIILDESQAIKNPESQTARSLMLLKSHNRIALSGTPVQNNTFDLYSQFNFLNPGLLGNKQFFKDEFANAIDKKQDEEKTQQLRKIVYPFMLRRTKEQVAPDLPEKIESIIWCEMEPEQRKVYDEYKKFYRDSLMERIASEGIQRAGIYILEGLLRLRQICDSPKLLKKKEFNKIGSTKLDELLREIEDNIGNHKMLVFSQFTEMLGLIEDEFKKKKIKYAYLDGSTKQSERQVAVEKFQQNEDCRIFLISLKAGGVGLNLTAADYVFLIDPWWNPAAEQQAIDRTHRIGQTKKIIAYKMICKDSVEEKILALQSNKKKMAGELIGEDQAVMKKLKKEDIEYLFS